MAREDKFLSLSDPVAPLDPVTERLTAERIGEAILAVLGKAGHKKTRNPN